MSDLIFYYPEGHQNHYEAGHPERPERVETIKNTFEKVGLWQQFPKLAPKDITLDFLKTVHSATYLDWLPGFCLISGHIDADTYTTPDSWTLALNAAGGAVAIAEQVWQSNEAVSSATRGFALTRPPGHHANRLMGMGFCLLNNIAIAAEYLINAYGNGNRAKRVAIVDLDLHHGNGTQDIFWKRDDVLYISTHQSPLFPGTGRLEDVGAGDGEGFTVNLPLPPGTGDAGFLAMMDEIIIPLLSRYMPEIILVSFGFDPHWRDPLGYLMMTAGGYSQLIQSLVKWSENNCHGRLALFLEGGYDLAAASACSLAACSAMLNLPFEDPIGSSPRFEGKSWQSVLREAKKIWKV